MTVPRCPDCKWHTHQDYCRHPECREISSNDVTSCFRNRLNIGPCKPEGIFFEMKEPVIPQKEPVIPQPRPVRNDNPRQFNLARRKPSFWQRLKNIRITIQ